MANPFQDMVNVVSEAHKKLDAEMAGISDEVFYGVPKEGEWAISENLGHIMELQWFWMDKVNLILKEDNPRLFRSEGENASRLALPAAWKGYTREIILRVLKHANQDTLDDIAKLPSDKLDRTGTRNDGKVVTIPQQVEIIANHILVHVNQIAENKKAL